MCSPLRRVDDRPFLKKLADGMDFFFNKVLPKKVIVLTIATIIVFKKIQVPSEYWYILMAYFGANVVGKVTSAIGRPPTLTTDSIDEAG